jgi:hypothetical protein
MREVSDRRSFFTTLASVAGIAALRPGAAAAQAAAPSAGPFDMAWLEQVKGKHKQLYDLGAWNLGEDGRPLRFCKNFLDTFRDVYKLEHPGVNTAVGVSGPAIALNMTDRIWEKYKLGERSKIIDPMTKQPAVRNIFMVYEDRGDQIGVTAMQARGAVFWQCNVALGAVAFQLANATGKPFQDVRAELVAGLNPGVKLVPAHTLLVGMAQERGFTYEKP